MLPISYNFHLFPKIENAKKDDEPRAIITFLQQFNSETPLPLKKEVAYIQINQSGKALLKSKGCHFSKEDVKIIVEAVCFASERIEVNILESILKQMIEMPESLSENALLKALKKWGKINNSPDDTPYLLLALQTGSLPLIKKLIDPLWNSIQRVNFAKNVSPHHVWKCLFGSEVNTYISNKIKDFNCTPCVSLQFQEKIEGLTEVIELLFSYFQEEEQKIQFSLAGLLFMPIFNASNLTNLLLSKLPLEQKQIWLSDNIIRVMLQSTSDFCLTLIKAGADKTKLFNSTALFGRQDILEDLIKKGLIDCANDKGLTALISAVHYDQLLMAKFLLDKEAKIFVKRKPISQYACSDEVKNLILEYDKSNSIFYFDRLSIITHHFQIIYEAESPLLKGAELEGSKSIWPSQMDILKKSYKKSNFVSNWKLGVDNYFIKCLLDFKNFFDQSLDSSNPWLKQIILALQETSNLIQKTSFELVETYQKGKGIPLTTWWDNHATYMWLEKNILFHSNTGQKSKEKITGTTFYYIPDTLKVTPEVIESLREGERDYIEQGVIQDLNLQFLGTAPSKIQKGGFCSIRSFLIFLKGIMILKHMQEIPSKNAFLTKFETSKEAIAEIYRNAKNYTMDLELGRLLDLYETESFQPELPLLLFILSKLSENSKYSIRLIEFLKKNKPSLECVNKNRNVFHYLKGEKNYLWLEEIFGKEVVQQTVSKLINTISEPDYVTPLFLAIDQKQQKRAEFLLKLGANPLLEVNNDSGIKKIIREDNAYLLNLIFEHMDGSLRPKLAQEMLYYSMFHARSEVISVLLKFGANVNETEWNFYPLSACFVYKDLQVAKLLLQHGADPFKKIEDRYCNSFDVAIQMKHLGLLRLIFESLDINARPSIALHLFNSYKNIIESESDIWNYLNQESGFEKK